MKVLYFRMKWRICSFRLKSILVVSYYIDFQTYLFIYACYFEILARIAGFLCDGGGGGGGGEEGSVSAGSNKRLLTVYMEEYIIFVRTIV